MKKLFQNLYNSEHFVYKLELKNTRVLWIAIGSFLTYNYFSFYLKMNEIRAITFQKNFQKYQDKYRKQHFEASKSSIDLLGFPDQGDWLYSKEIPELDLKEFLKAKENYEDKRSEFSYIIPLYIISGLWTPLTTSFIGGGLIFINWKLEKKDNERMERYKEYIIYGLVFNAFISSLALRFY